LAREYPCRCRGDDDDVRYVGRRDDWVAVADLAFFHRVCHRNFFLYNLVKPFDKQLWKFTTEFGIKALNNVKISLKFNN